MNKKEKTDKIYHSQYKVDEPFIKPEKGLYDKSDWEFRKYKKYDTFTKSFDKNVNFLKKK